MPLRASSSTARSSSGVLLAARVAGETHTLDGVVDWLREHRDEPFFLFVHSWATHMPHHVPHGEHTEWRQAKLRYLAQIQGGTAAGLEACYEEYRRVSNECPRRSSRRSSTSSSGFACARRRRSRSSPTTASPRASACRQGGRQGDLPPARGDALRRGAERPPDPVGAGPGAAGGALAGELGRPRAGAGGARGRRDAAGDGSSLLRYAAEDGADEAVLAATSDRGTLSQLGVRLPPWKLVRHLADRREQAFRLDADPRERRDRASEAPSELRDLLDRELDGVERAI